MLLVGEYTEKEIIPLAVPIFVAHQAKRRLVSSLTTTRDSITTSFLIPFYLDSVIYVLDSGKKNSLGSSSFPDVVSASILPEPSEQKCDPGSPKFI